jgi:hypothetical protein
VDVSQLKLKIEETIRDNFAEEDISVFWPEHFVDDGFGNLDEILRALKELVAEGKVDVLAQVHCPEGHLCFEGPPAELRDLWLPPCGECGADVEDFTNLTSVIFVLRDQWAECLLGSRQKKRSMRCGM